MLSTAISSKRFNLFAIVSITVVTLLCYYNSLEVPFQFDDEDHINEHHLAKGPQKFLKAQNVLKDNRLVANISFSINFLVHGLDPAGYHLVNITIHAASGIIIYFLVILLFKTPGIASKEINEYSGLMALSSALLFVSHPVQTQAVTYIIQRYASLCAMFYLLATLLYVKFRLAQKRPVYIKVLFYILSLISTCLAMKTKEIAFTLPVVITIVELIFFKGTKKRFIYLLPFFLTMSIIPLALININKPVGDIIGDIPEIPREDPSISRPAYFFTQLRVIVTYLRLLVVPINQNLDYDYRLFHSLLIPEVLLSGLLIALLLISVGYLVFRTRKDGPQEYLLISFGILFFFTALAVESGIIPIRDVINEHRLYLPSAGFFIAFPVGLFLVFKALFKEKTLNRFVLVVSALIIVLSSATILRNNVWKSKLSLWTDVVSKSPNKARAHNNLGNSYFIKNDFLSAIPEYKKAIEINRKWYESYYNLAMSLEKTGRQSEAVYYYRVFVKEAPPYYNQLKQKIKSRYGLGS